MGTLTVASAKQDLTKAEKKCLEAFKRLSKKLKPLCPSRRELADEMGLSVPHTAYLVTRLLEKGHLIDNGNHRSLQLV